MAKGKRKYKAQLVYWARRLLTTKRWHVFRQDPGTWTMSYDAMNPTSMCGFAREDASTGGGTQYRLAVLKKFKLDDNNYCQRCLQLLEKDDPHMY